MFTKPLTKRQIEHMSQFLARSAEQIGVTTEEVKEGIETAVEAAFDSPEQVTRDFWRALPLNDQRPTAEEATYFILAEMMREEDGSPRYDGTAILKPFAPSM